LHGLIVSTPRAGSRPCHWHSKSTFACPRTVGQTA
jgi:hypothetical protein